MVEESDFFLEGSNCATKEYTPTIPNLIHDFVYSEEKLAELNTDDAGDA